MDILKQLNEIGTNTTAVKKADRKQSKSPSSRSPRKCPDCSKDEGDLQLAGNLRQVGKIRSDVPVTRKDGKQLRSHYTPVYKNSTEASKFRLTRSLKRGENLLDRWKQEEQTKGQSRQPC